jgi:mRNA-degrading endonuclease toxin of MazEF toxin-antitoxin module
MRIESHAPPKELSLRLVVRDCKALCDQIRAAEH